jgi:flagellar basal-body rod modification protein FlgD
VTNPVTQAGTTPPTTTGGSSTSGSSGLGEANFLQLLVGQLQNQDPLQPTDDQSWIQEMAQFSEVQQVSQMNESNTKILSALNQGQAVGLIGHKVTYTDKSGNPVTGTVGGVDLSSGSPTLTVDGQTGIDPTTVTAVQ